MGPAMPPNRGRGAPPRRRRDLARRGPDAQYRPGSRPAKGGTDRGPILCGPRRGHRGGGEPQTASARRASDSMGPGEGGEGIIRRPVQSPKPAQRGAEGAGLRRAADYASAPAGPMMAHGARGGPTQRPACRSIPEVGAADGRRPGIDLHGGSSRPPSRAIHCARLGWGLDADAQQRRRAPRPRGAPGAQDLQPGQARRRTLPDVATARHTSEPLRDPEAGGEAGTRGACIGERPGQITTKAGKATRSLGSLAYPATLSGLCIHMIKKQLSNLVD